MNDFKPDLRSVYFDTLFNDPPYRAALNQGQEYLLNSNKLQEKMNEKDKNNKTNFDHILDVLRLAIIKEREVETRYFEDVIQRSERIGLDKSKIKELFQSKLDGAIDYKAIINFINQILSGAETYKQILRLEEKRGEQLDKAYKNLEKKFKEYINKNKQIGIRVNPNSKTETEHHRTTYYDDFQQWEHDIYLTRHNMVSTLSNGIFNDVIPSISTIFANISSKIIAENIEKNAINIFEVKKYNQLITVIMREIKQQLSSVIDKEIEDQEQQIIDNILKKMQGDLDTIIQNVPEFSDQALIKTSKTATIGYDKKTDTISGEGVADAAIRLYDLLHTGAIGPGSNPYLNKMLSWLSNDYKRNYLTGSQLTSEYIIDENGEYVRNKKGKKKRKVTVEKKGEIEEYSFETAIGEIKDIQEALAGELSDAERAAKTTQLRTKKGTLSTRLSGLIREQLKRKTIDKQKLINTWINALNEVLYTISPSQFSELLSKAAEEGVDALAYFGGDSNRKADVMSIRLIMPTHVITKDLAEPLINSFKANITQFFKNFEQQLLKDKNGKKYDNSFSLEKGERAFQYTVTQFLTAAKEQIQQQDQSARTQEEQIDMLKDLANALQNQIFTTTTVKDFHQYNKKFGFVAGSMGPDIMAQVENFATLFAAAGVPLTTQEQNWLITAIINCSPRSIAAQNRGPIEKYLSALAAFAVFDEGSVEIQQVLGNLEIDIGNGITTSGPSIMHLYKLNGLYFPGSFILERIYDKLSKTINNSLSDIQNINDGVHIVATAGPQLINSQIKDPTERWRDVANKAVNTNVTSLRVTFLSDLFNIVKQLDEALTSL